jgi:nickel superoxide dismutase
MIEAMSVLRVAEKYHASDDEVFRARALAIKEERAEDVKHHLMVLWADFFTADHRAEFPNLDDLFWRAIHQAGTAKKTVDPADGQKLIDLIQEIADIFWQTEKAKGMGVYPPS